MKVSNNQIREFWNWFSKSHTQLHSDTYTEDTLDILDQTLSNWNLSWEIGPGIQSENSLSISGNGDVELSTLAKTIIGKAPTIEGWEFFNFRQTKDNWNQLELSNQYIEASNWEFVAIHQTSGKTKVLIKANNLNSLTLDMQIKAIEMVVLNLLGEEIYLSKIDSLNIIESSSKEFWNHLINLKFLPEHL